MMWGIRGTCLENDGPLPAKMGCEVGSLDHHLVLYSRWEESSTWWGKTSVMVENFQDARSTRLILRLLSILLFSWQNVGNDLASGVEGINDTTCYAKQRCRSCACHHSTSFQIVAIWYTHPISPKIKVDTMSVPPETLMETILLEFYQGRKEVWRSGAQPVVVSIPRKSGVFCKEDFEVKHDHISNRKWIHFRSNNQILVV